MPSLRENTTAVVIRGEHVSDGFTSEPYEAGWAIEAVLFLRILEKDSAGGEITVQLSPDGMNWVSDTHVDIPKSTTEVSHCRISHFGNWLRLRATMPEGKEAMLLATLHCKG